MPGVLTRDLADVGRAFTAWFGGQVANQHLEATALDVTLRAHAAGGYSNEVIFATVTFAVGGERHEQRLVLRLAPDGPALFPSYDLAMQVAVQDAVSGHGVPVPRPIIHEQDAAWLGAPFLVMPLVEGHNPGELPVVDGWVASATVAQQRTLHEGFLDALASIHSTPWINRAVATHLRGATDLLVDEVQWWEDLVAWTFDGAPPQELTDVFAWCRVHLPTDEPERSLLWGDVRLGNVMFDDAFAPAAVLDWEMASIGPAELDLAWHTALEGMTEHFVGQRVPGFLTRDEIVSRHERALGRPLVDFRWFEIFAMCRSAVLNIRADRLGAQRRGRIPRPPGDNAVLAYTAAVIADLR